jgi:hypothetical protein
MRKCVISIVAWIALIGAAQSQQSCGNPPRVDDQTLKGDLEGKAQFLSKLVGDANLKGQIETARTDIFSKYPNAGAAHSDAYLEYMFCTFVLTDPKLTGQEKFRAILEFREAEREPMRHPPTVVGAPGGITAGGDAIGNTITGVPSGTGASSSKP